MNEDFLNQDEIDALLSQGPDDSHGGAGSGSSSHGGSEGHDDQEAIMDASPEQDLQRIASDDTGALPELTEMEKDTLSEIGNISMGSAATALSTMVNRKVSITVPDVFVSTPANVRGHYPIPCIVVNVEYVRGLSGNNLLVIKERDAALIGNLMMGEDGSNPPEEVDELYLSAVTEAMNMMMGSAATAMSDLFSTAIDISPPTTDRRNLRDEELNLGEERPVISVAFRIEIGDLVDSIMLQIIDYEFAREMVHQLIGPYQEETSQEPGTDADLSREAEGDMDWGELSEPTSTTQHTPGAQTGLGPAAAYQHLGNLNVDLIRDIPVQVRAVLGKTHMPIDSILKLGPGHIMELETLDGEPIDVFANDTLIAKGEVVVVGEQFGIRITEIATQQDRINSIR